MPRLFLLSPAKVDGVRAKQLLSPRASSELARRFQSEGATIADLFAYASSLYFRGKIAYARRFAAKGDVIRVITANAGLVPPDRVLKPVDLLDFGTVDIHEADPRYSKPLQRDAKALRRKLGARGDVEAILFGSIATGKYRDVLLEVFGDRLRFPAEFVGRGDMSRGGLMLRAVRAGEELRYIAVSGAMVRGERPPRLPQTRAV